MIRVLAGFDDHWKREWTKKGVVTLSGEAKDAEEIASLGANAFGARRRGLPEFPRKACQQCRRPEL